MAAFALHRGASGPSAARPPSVELRPHVDESARVTPGALEVAPTWHEAADDHVRPEDCDELLPAWGAPDRALLEDALTRGGLDAAARGRLLADASCDGRGCTVTPPDELVASLASAQRAALHAAMRGYTQATMLRSPFARPVTRPAMSADPRLPPAAREVIARGEWVEGDTRYFAELHWLCRRVTDRAERAAFFRVLRARSGLDVAVRVQRGDDLDAMAGWWAAGSSREGVRARFERALADGSGRVPLRELLPPAMRARLGTYPPRDTRFDCFWTALNFFSPTPEGGPWVNRDDFDTAVDTWREVPLEAIRFGDALAFRTAAGLTRHAAVYLAEDLVLTKDGWSMHRPWEVSRIGDLRRIYHDASSVTAYRRP